MMNEKANQDENDSQLDAAAILLSLKSTPPSFPSKKSKKGDPEGSTTGYIPIYDWTQAVPTLSYAGNTYNINLQMYNSPIRLVPVPLNDQDRSSFKEMSIAFVKFCQIHRDTILLHDPSMVASKVNEKLVHLWTLLSDEEKVVYSKVAKNEMLLIQGKDISSDSNRVKTEPALAEQSDCKNQLLQGGIEKSSPSLFRHPMFSIPGHHSPKIESDDDKATCQKTVLSSAAEKKFPKQRSVSLSDKPCQKVFIRRAVSHDDLIGDNGNFAKPTCPDNSPNKKYLIRMRRHSMNDGILTSAMEKINPYFTKNYSKSPLKARNQYPKSPSPQIPTSPSKRSLPASSLDMDKKSTIRSPPKKNKNLPIEADIFDFQSEPHSTIMKGEPEDDINNASKSETYSYSLLKGASKTSSVNPCFSSRKTFVKKLNTSPSKCVSTKRESCCNNSRSCTCPYHLVKSPTDTDQEIQECTAQKSANYRIYDREKDWVLRHGLISKPQNTTYIQKLIENSRPSKIQGGHHRSGVVNKTGRHISPQLKEESDGKAEQDKMEHSTDSKERSPAKSNSSTSSDLSFKLGQSGTNESKKLELLNDSVLLSHAIAELENAEESRYKGSRRSHVSGSLSGSDVRYRHVYKLFREHGLNPSPKQITEFYHCHKDVFSCKSAALLTIREVKQKIIKLQLM